MSDFECPKEEKPDVCRNLEFRTFTEGQLAQEDKLSLVRRFGSETLSYSTAVQDGLMHFGNRDGYLAFQRKFGYTFVLGNPVADCNCWDELLSKFLIAHPKPAFCQISEPFADLLSKRKYWINEMGIDTRLDLDDYDFRGKQKERFRYAENWLRRRGFEIKELPLSDALSRKAQALANRWRNTRSVKQETAFINRPIEYLSQPDMRRFFLFEPNGKLAAFVFFDPIYFDGKTIGYVTSFKRRDPNAPSLAELGICKVAIEQFRGEGKSMIKLGLSPMANIEDGHFKYNWIMKRSFNYVFNAKWANLYFYNLTGHAEFKKRFRGEAEKTYFATPSFVNDFRLFALLKLCKIL